MGYDPTLPGQALVPSQRKRKAGEGRKLRYRASKKSKGTGIKPNKRMKKEKRKKNMKEQARTQIDRTTTRNEEKRSKKKTGADLEIGNTVYASNPNARGISRKPITRARARDKQWADHGELECRHWQTSADEWLVGSKETVDI